LGTQPGLALACVSQPKSEAGGSKDGRPELKTKPAFGRASVWVRTTVTLIELVVYNYLYCTEKITRVLLEIHCNVRLDTGVSFVHSMGRGKKGKKTSATEPANESDKENSFADAIANNENSRKCTWSDKDDHTMMQVLRELKETGYQADSGWKSTTWTIVAKKLTESGTKGPTKTPEKCQDHYSNVRLFAPLPP
jgi:hypothetical protein